MKVEQTFEELLKAAPKAPSVEMVSLTGTLARANDATKFVLLVAHGNPITLDIAAVKSHAVLGYANGQPVVRVDIARESLPEGTARPMQPFSLTSGHQVAPEHLAALQANTSGTLGDVGTPASYDAALQANASGTLGDVGTPASYDVAALQANGSGTLGDVGTPASYDVALQANASGTLGDVGTPASYDLALQARASGTLGDVGTVASYDIF